MRGVAGRRPGEGHRDVATAGVVVVEWHLRGRALQTVIATDLVEIGHDRHTIASGHGNGAVDLGRSHRRAEGK